MSAPTSTPNTLDQIAWDEAKARLGPGAKLSDVAILAQKIKTLALNPPDAAADWRDVLLAVFAWILVWFVIGVALHLFLK